MKLADQGSAGEVAVDDNFEDVIMEIGFGEVPKIIVSFVEKIQLVETFDPADFDGDVEILFVLRGVVDGVFELVDADGVTGRDDGPIVGFAVDTGDLVGGDLKDAELDAGAFEGEEGEGEEEEQCSEMKH